jgi:23S rRNA pseudouridine2605 synthase
LVGGNGGGGVNRGSTGCTCNGTGAGTGGRGGNPGVAGNNGTGTQRRGFGGAAGLAVQGNGSGSSISNFGTQIGGVNP